MTIVRNFIKQGVANCSKIKAIFRLRSSALENTIQHTATKMDKRRIKMVIKVLEEVKAQFPETKEFIDERVEQECSKENILVEDVIFLHV